MWAGLEGEQDGFVIVGSHIDSVPAGGWLDGALVESNEARIPLMAHAAQRGSLVFDVGSFHPTPRGPALFRAREHVARTTL